MNTTKRVEQASVHTNYGSYYYSPTDTFESVAKIYNISAKTLAQMNNISGTIPKYIKDAKQLKGKNYVSVPLIGNGGEQNSPLYYYYTPLTSKGVTGYAKQSSKLGGSYNLTNKTDSPVRIIVNGIVLNIPCYPTSISDSVSANFSSESLFTSTEPYVVFSNSGPRSVSVSFRFHREMRGIDYDTYIDTIIYTLQAACYPVNDGAMAVPVRLIIANEINIMGVLSGGVSTSYEPPIIDGKYNIVNISFTIQEVYGSNISYASKRSMGGKVGR